MRPRKPAFAWHHSCSAVVVIAMSWRSATTSCSGKLDRLRPETLVHVWVMMGGASCHTGEFQQSLAFSEKAIDLDDKVNCTHKAPWAAADPAIVARDYVEMVSRLTGHFERSLTISEQSMAIALDRGHLFSIVWASVSRVFALRGFGRYAEAVACADRAIEICERYGFDARIGNVLLHRGPVLFELGDEERGLADLQRGVDLMAQDQRHLHAGTEHDDACRLPAPREPDSSRPAPASVKPKASPRRPRKRITLAEIIRLRGRIWQSEGHHEEARLCFERAIARSREQRARLFELHAARDLARLSAEAGGSTDGA